MFLHIQQCKSKLPLCTAKVLTCKSCRRREKRSKQSWPRCLGFLACAYNTFHIISNSWHLHIETLFLPLRFSGIKRQNHECLVYFSSRLHAMYCTTAFEVALLCKPWCQPTQGQTFARSDICSTYISNSRCVLRTLVWVISNNCLAHVFLKV